MGSSRAVAGAMALSALATLSGCVYFNKFYSAKKNFNDAEKMYERPDARATPQQVQLYDKSLRSASKILVEHPTSGWVDDAVLLMGRSLLGKGDYAKAREKFEEFYANFPKSPLLDQALFYHGETFRRERQWESALALYDSLSARFPESEILTTARLQEGKIYGAQSRYPRAIASIQPVVERGGDLELEGRLALADAYFGAERFDSAATQYEWVTRKSKSPELVHECVLRLGQCFESRADYAAAILVYQEWAKRTTNLTYRDQAQIRVGSAQALAGDATRGIETLEAVIAARRRTPAAAEALFQIGYIQEVTLDDFATARATYAKVEEEARNSTFAQQAKHRMENLDRIQALRESAGSDSAGAGGSATAAFNLAEHYLFEVGNPARALDAYGRVEREFPESPYAAKAAFAGAWILERKLEMPAPAESAWRHVATRYPETEHGRAAAAFLGGGVDSLRAVGPLEAASLSHPYTPGATPYVKPSAKLQVQGPSRAGPPGRSAAAAAVVDSLALADSLRMAAERLREPERERADTLAAGDSAASQPPPPDSTGGAAPDTARYQAPDTTGVVTPDTTSASSLPDGRRAAARRTAIKTLAVALPARREEGIRHGRLAAL